MNNIIEYLQQSKRPLLLIGAGARGAIDEIIAFAQRWQIPMETTWNAVDLVPFTHPLFVGRPGIVATRGSNWALQACDCLLAIGARLDEPTVAYDYYNFARGAKKIMVDVDLGEHLKIPNIDAFHHGTAESFIKALAKETFNITPLEWVTQCTEWKQTRMEGTTTTYKLLDNMNRTLPDDEILVVNCGCQAVNIFCAGFQNKAGQRYIMSSCGLGSMGGAVPVAIGAAIASGKHVTVIDGDGSFCQNLQELETIRRLELPITIYVISNGGYASIRSSETRAFGRHREIETLPNLSLVAEAFGVKIIEVMAEHDEMLLPRIMFDGRGCLEDMYPYE